MPHQDYVVNDPATGLYLLSYADDWGACQWSTAENAMGFITQSDADKMAAKIGHGTVGTPRP